MRFLSLLMIVGMGLYAVNSTAQVDQHFTQFYAAPLTLNPALTGGFSGNYRVSAIYRDQWRTVQDQPFRTFAAMYDMRFGASRQGTTKKDFGAVGLLVFSDKVPAIDFSTNTIQISGAFHKSLGYRNTQYLSAGFQAGIAQRNVNYERFTFSDMFNGTSGYNNPSAEELPVNNFSYPDLSAGINYALTPGNGYALYAGLAVHHIFQPEVSFYDLSLFPESTSPLFRKYSAQLSAQIPLSEKISLLPRAIVAVQGPHLEINTGTNFRITLGGQGNTALHLGTWVRPVKDINSGLAIEAIIAMVGLEYNNVVFGFSYDATLLDLSSTRRGQAALEFSVAYLGDYENDTILCPKF